MVTGQKLCDDIRPEAQGVVDELKASDLRTVVLTGDRLATAEHLKSKLHLDKVRAELKPEEKVAAIKALSEGKNRVAMIGDGVNDAPSLAVAHVGARFGCGAGAGGCAFDARPAGEFSRSVSLESVGAAHHPPESFFLAWHGGGAGGVCIDQENPAACRRGGTRGQHGDCGDEQFAVAVRRGEEW